MKKITCTFLLCVVLFSLSGCSLTKGHISEIIENYDKYSEVLSDKGIESKVEDSDTKPGRYLNMSGKVLTVFSPDGHQYVFSRADRSNKNYPSLRGDTCQIYSEVDSKVRGLAVRCNVSICIQFRNKETRVVVRYNNRYPSADKTAEYVGGAASYYYLEGDFTPDLSDKDSSFLPSNDQESDNCVKYFVSDKELSAYYNQACEYYETLCSVLED